MQTATIQTPFDYNIAFGVRKIARFGYENRAQTFYDGTEDSWSDGANVGKVKGLEFLFEVDYTRQQGNEYLDQHLLSSDTVLTHIGETFSPTYFDTNSKVSISATCSVMTLFFTSSISPDEPCCF